ncbi:cysteine desulfurase NifS [Candidatus Wolfebacteria bacterium CG18_big_fil_WC_8_21_14_2_50_39_7]|uniref:Cysteine desulfurase NifS n=5 Tax=Candidatus Wolfeibacteriota TaxID=1752735 RepID=A0A2M7Q718_9BACT|nr:cysteine desulfurase [Parcubacteria group bacterium]NCO89450.1 cysteine desulfurase [Candidatus Wolfebacteria bacterium]OIO65879.1 MAG: cysteine desulfurase NifS [Candidatus Wolfebacteria bacterium CG1_02_39_135]PIP92143.1 MAG: cysteine desulfurase NifS [Candidatus Wolfebacteria bacterium CG18_big_fil_WC_8_21_14_2_50_39_7]PIU98770.1 MAG: cysteine desulfurase NifS [Candidatus Wolfebacteria bacterium CG03_land_8_20_14_0_80_39_317]PIY59208.1 MAG: cysteine desulfurase NifS [Candidatus Wolfebact
MKKIYLDYAATTYIDPRVLQKMRPYLTNAYGNASSLYLLGREAKNAIEKAREDVARILGASSQEIIFTGSGTESANMAIYGIAKAYCNQGNHIVVSKIEHKAVLESAKRLEKEGFKITYLNVDSQGIVKLNELKKALNRKTILVSIMYANNEIGAIQPIKEISKIIKKFRRENLLPAFHSDACQAAGASSLRVDELGVDLLTLNGSKIYGPKGIGCLYVSKDYKIKPLIVGGSQEMGLRAGTENTALIVGFSEALKLAEQLRKREGQRLRNLRNYFIKKVLKLIPHCQLNGHSQKRLPNNINLSFDGIEGESLVLKLDQYGISTSTGSACTSTDLTPSHVLLALGVPEDLAHGSLRLTLGRKTTKKDLDYVLKILPKVVGNLRKISAIQL